MVPCKTYWLLALLILTFVGIGALPVVAENQKEPLADPKQEEQTAPSEPANPDLTDWKKGEWGDLSTYIGTYRYDAVMDDPRVAKSIIALMKGSNIDLNSYFDTKTPIGFEDDCLILQGNATDRADLQAGFLTICLYKGSVHIATLLDDKITVYSPHTNYAYLTERMRTWIYLRAHPKTDITAKPANVQLFIRAE